MTAMKGTALIVLVVLVATALSPLAILALPVAGSNQPALGMLDVCHQASPALTPVGEMPCLGQAPCSAVPALLVSSFVPENTFFVHYLIPSQDDRPPRA